MRFLSLIFLWLLTLINVKWSKQMSNKGQITVNISLSLCGCGMMGFIFAIPEYILELFSRYSVS